jgi:hypothetical protein
MNYNLLLLVVFLDLEDINLLISDLISAFIACELVFTMLIRSPCCKQGHFNIFVGNITNNSMRSKHYLAINAKFNKTYLYLPLYIIITVKYDPRIELLIFPLYTVKTFVTKITK